MGRGTPLTLRFCFRVSAGGAGSITSASCSACATSRANVPVLAGSTARSSYELVMAAGMAGAAALAAGTGTAAGAAFGGGADGSSSDGSYRMLRDNGTTGLAASAGSLPPLPFLLRFNMPAAHEHADY